MKTPIVVNFIFMFTGVALAILELVVGVEAAFDLVIVGAALFIGGGVGYLTNSVLISLSAIIVQLIVYFLFGRQFLQHRLQIQRHPSNVDAIIGKKLEILKWDDEAGKGRVKINGEEWNAFTDDEHLDTEQTVYAKGVQGVKLLVSNQK